MGHWRAPPELKRLHPGALQRVRRRLRVSPLTGCAFAAAAVGALLYLVFHR